MSEWQPIETAPKDGKTVLIWEKYGYDPVVAHYACGKWWASIEHYETNGNANVIDTLSDSLITHWMPLPEPPNSARE